jgi:hypothetical protein
VSCKSLFLYRICYFINSKVLLLFKYSVGTLTSIWCTLFICAYIDKNVCSLRSQIWTKRPVFNLFGHFLYFHCLYICKVSDVNRESILLAVALFLKWNWSSVVSYLFLSHCRASILLKWRIFTLFMKFGCLFTRVALHFHKNEQKSIFILWCYSCVCTSIIVFSVIAVKTTCIFKESVMHNLNCIALYIYGKIAQAI